MEERLKQLRLLIWQVLALGKEAEAQIAALRQRVRQMEESAAKLREAESELKALREWKRNTQTALKRLAARVDKEIQKAQEKRDEIV